MNSDDDYADSEQDGVEHDDEQVDDGSGQEYRSDDDEPGGDRQQDDKSDQDDDGDVNVMSAADPTKLDDARDVKNQLDIWNSLLEWRISLQKVLVATNKLPQCDAFQQLRKRKAAKKCVSGAHTALTAALESLLDIEKSMVDNNTQLSGTTRDNCGDDDDEEIPSDEEMLSDDDDDEEAQEENDADSDADEHEEQGDDAGDEEETDAPAAKRLKLSDIGDVDEHLDKCAERLRSYRDDVLDQWYYKTRYTGGKGSMDAFEVAPVKVIEQIMANKERLIKRTQLRRSNYAILGKCADSGDDEQVQSTKADEYDCEIFDDDDFYHQLLRELIEEKTSTESDTSAVALSRKWIEIQRMRSKMKRKVDTRASKGRKIKFENTIKPLIGYMAKQPNELMGNEEIDELFASVFGKRID